MSCSHSRILMSFLLHARCEFVPVRSLLDVRVPKWSILGLRQVWHDCISDNWVVKWSVDIAVCCQDVKSGLNNISILHVIQIVCYSLSNSQNCDTVYPRQESQALPSRDFSRLRCTIHNSRLRLSLFLEVTIYMYYGRVNARLRSRGFKSWKTRHGTVTVSTDYIGKYVITFPSRRYDLIWNWKVAWSS